MFFRHARLRRTLQSGVLAMLGLAVISSETASYNDPHHYLMEGTQSLRYAATRAIGSPSEIMLIASLGRQATDASREARESLVESGRQLRVDAIRAARAPANALLIAALERPEDDVSTEARDTMVRTAMRLRADALAEPGTVSAATVDGRFPLDRIGDMRFDCDSDYYGSQICDEANFSKELTCLTQGIYFESRGEPAEGKQAVAKVILNRVASRRYPGTICGVVYQGANRRVCQFSWACDGRTDVPRNMAAWRRSLTVAADTLANPEKVPLGTSVLSFHSTAVNPQWRLRRVATIGLHMFYSH